MLTSVTDNKRMEQHIAYLMVVSDSTLHRSPSVVMLNPKSNIGCQSPIIFWDCAFNLQPQIACYSKVEHTVSDGGNPRKTLNTDLG
jgi:hypothetical protein